MIDPLTRLADVRELIDKELYFVLHAPRQSGKTTLLEVLAKKSQPRESTRPSSFRAKPGKL
jgi:predicted AAA+ superfamily ATPase